MSTIFTEADYENSVIELFRNYSPSIAMDYRPSKIGTVFS